MPTIKIRDYKRGAAVDIEHDGATVGNVSVKSGKQAVEVVFFDDNKKELQACTGNASAERSEDISAVAVPVSAYETEKGDQARTKKTLEGPTYTVRF